MRLLLILLTGSMAFAAGEEHRFIRSDILVVKIKQPANHWNSVLEDFKKSPVSSEIRSIRPAFGRVGSGWGAPAGFPADQFYTVRLKSGASLSKAIDSLASLGSVESVQPDYVLTDPWFEIPNDPRLSEQWYLSQLRVPEAWEITRGQGMWVADVESGFDTSHPDLKTRFDLEKSFDYDPQTNDPKNVNDNKRSHGTPVCGLIGAEGNNKLFGVGVAFEAKLIGSQMANSMTSHSTESIWTVNAAKAILGSIERGASVILIEKQVPSLLSSVERVKVIYDAIKAAVEAGIPVVVPAGNFGTELKGEAEQPDTGSIFVGATTRAGLPASFTNFGDRLSVAAPGEEVYSIQENNGEIFEFGGTSSASAITAGVVALVRAAKPTLSPRELRLLIRRTGKPLGPEAPLPDRMGVLPSLLDNENTKKIGPLLQAGPAVLAALGE